jgi:hypothetical protein
VLDTECVYVWKEPGDVALVARAALIVSWALSSIATEQDFL